MADELDADLGQTPLETPAESTPPPSPTPSPAPAAAATIPAAPAQTTPQANPTPSAPSYESARDFAAKALGYKADTYNDDESFLRAVIVGERTYKQQLDEARQLLYQHQQSQQQPKPADKPDPLARYKAPEFNPAWLSMVEKTPEGDFRLRPGADPSILPKIHAYQQYTSDFAQKLTADPLGTLTPMIRHFAAEEAQALVKEQFQRAQEGQYVNSFLKDNSNWLIQADSQGRFVTNPATGQAMLSPAGERFLYYMQEAEQFGITHPAAQERYAANGLRAELYAPNAQGNAAVTAGEQQKQALLQTMNRGNKSGSMTPPESGGPPTQNEALSLRDRLMRLPFNENAA